MSDDRTEDLLRKAMQAADQVPPDVVDAGRGAFAWIDLSAQLARLETDSLAGVGAGLRDGGDERQLVFRSSDHEIHLTISGTESESSLVGQFHPAEDASVVARVPGGGEFRTDTRRPGRFAFEALPPGPVRLEITTASGELIVAEWTAV